MGNEEDNPRGPDTKKMTYDFENEYFKIGACEMQGWRKTMEDAAIILSNFDKKNTSLFGILDGHGGSVVSKFVAYNLKALLIRTEAYKKGNYEQALIESFLLMDDILGDQEINKFISKSQFQNHIKIVSAEPGEPNYVKFFFESNYIQYNLTKFFDNLSNNNDSEIYTTIYTDTENKKENLSNTIDEKKIDENNKKNENNEKISGVEVNENFNEEQFLINFNTKKKNVEEKLKIKISRSDTHQRIIAELMGSTANIMLIKDNIIYLANVGDSLSVMYTKNNKAIKLNREHKTTLKSEEERISKSGAEIKNKRINGILNLARALGDLKFKENFEKGRNEQSVISYPEITKISNIKNIDFIIMGCDGVWDCHPDKEEFCKEVKELIDKEPEGKLSEILKKKFDEDISDVNGVPVGTDNMSCIIIQFKQQKVEEKNEESEESSEEEENEKEEEEDKNLN